MKRNKRNITVERAKYILSDWVTTSIAFFCFNIFRFYYLSPHIDVLGLDNNWNDLTEFLSSTKIIGETIFVPLVFLLIDWLSGFYNKPYNKSRLQELLTTFFSAATNALIFYLAALTNDNLFMRRESWLLIAMLFSLIFIFTYTGRFIITAISLKHFKRGEWTFNTVIIGDSEAARLEAEKLTNSVSASGINIKAFLHINGDHSSDKIATDIPVLENLDELIQMAKNKEVDQVIIVPSKYVDREKTILNLLHNLFPYDIAIRIKPDLLAFLTPSIRQVDIKAEPYIDISTPNIGECTKNIKRFFDMIASCIVLVVFSPLYLGLAIAIKMNSKGPVFYTQERIGLHGKPFKIYKFRSMKTDAEASGPQLSSDNDPRITNIGKILRKFRLDEIPQFWNVLKGDMSMVGPRPEREFFIEKIMQTAPWYSLVHQVRPGITSWGMVKYGYAGSVPEMIERNWYDLIYLSNMSIAVDIKIMIYTLRTVFTGKGV